LPRVISYQNDFLTFINDKNVSDILNADLECVRYFFIDGYFISSLSQQLFDEVLQGLFDLFTYKHLVVPNKMSTMHVRGGDFLKFEQYAICDSAYYRNAMLNMPDKIFTILTDDERYVRTLFDCSNFGIVSGTQFSDFLLIMNSKYVISSNSTFCFWALAFASLVNKNQKVIIPLNWEKNVPRNIKLYTEI
jgi:hypothetical protein